MIELSFLKVLMLIKQVNQKNVIFVTIQPDVKVRLKSRAKNLM